MLCTLCSWSLNMLCMLQRSSRSTLYYCPMNSNSSSTRSTPYSKSVLAWLVLLRVLQVPYIGLSSLSICSLVLIFALISQIKVQPGATRLRLCVQVLLSAEARCSTTFEDYHLDYFTAVPHDWQWLKQAHFVNDSLLNILVFIWSIWVTDLPSSILISFCFAGIWCRWFSGHGPLWRWSWP